MNCPSDRLVPFGLIAPARLRASWLLLFKDVHVLEGEYDIAMDRMREYQTRTFKQKGICNHYARFLLIDRRDSLYLVV